MIKETEKYLEQFDQSEDFSIILSHLKSENDKIFKDFVMLRDTFSREIDRKEEKRCSLIENIKQLESDKVENSKKEEIIDKNTLIYEKNQKEIEKRLTNLNERENWIKKNYRDVVHGTINNPQQLVDTEKPDSLSDIFYNLFKDNLRVHGHLAKTELEDLQRQKEKFLDTLKILFEKYDRELIVIDKEKIKLSRLKKEIEAKCKYALHKKKEIIKDNNKITKQVSKAEKELKINVKEERILIAEFQKIIQNIKADLNVSDMTMEVLSSSYPNEKEKKKSKKA